MKIEAAKDITNKGDARDFAICWQAWQGKQSLSWGEVSAWAEVFEKLGKKFDLLEEFKENGII